MRRARRPARGLQVRPGQGRGGRPQGHDHGRRGRGGRPHHDPGPRRAAGRRCTRSHIAPHLKDGDTLAFAHGFNIHYGYITPPEDRERHHVRARRAPATSCAASTPRAPACRTWSALSRTPPATPGTSPSPTAWGVGGARSGIIKATFKEETEEDLFGEQAVLCGGLVELVKAGFETLVEAGYPPELAYFECLPRDEDDRRPHVRVRHPLHELLHLQHRRVRRVLRRPQGHQRAVPRGHEARSSPASRTAPSPHEFVDDCNNDHKWLLEQREAINDHEIEKTGEKIRSMFSWIKKD